MKLRVKTLLIVGITLLCLLAILNVVTRQVLLSGFARVEYEDTERNAKRVLDAFDEAVNNLSVKAADWAKWDDTYRFVNDRNSEYVESNLTDESLAELKLNIMLFFDNRGRVTYSRRYDLETEAGAPVTPDDLAAVADDTLLVHHASVEGIVAGVKVFPGGAMNIVSRPVLTSSGEGPIAGTIVFGRYIDKKEVERIGGITHLSLMVERCGSPTLPADFAAADGKIGKDAPLFIKPLCNDRIAGYAKIYDIHGAPALILRADIRREIHQQGNRTMSYLIVTILAAGIIFGIVIMILLQKTVVSRVAKLVDDVNNIAEKGDHSARVRTQGNDELAALGNSVNGMLSALERVEEEVRTRNREMRLIMNTVPSGLLSIDENYRINPEYSKSVEPILMQTGLAGRDFFECIGLTADRSVDRELLSEFLEQVFLEALPEKEMAGLNPFEELRIGTKNGADAWVRLTYFIIHRGAGRSKHLLVVMVDITEAKALAARMMQTERENLQLKAVVEDPDMYGEFIFEVKKMLSFVLERFEVMASGGTDIAIVNEVFRSVHTIKGTAGAFGLSAVVEIAGRLETSIGACRKTAVIAPEIIRSVRQSLADLSGAIADVVEHAGKILGDDLDAMGGIILRIPLEKLKTGHMVIRDFIGRAPIDEASARRLTEQIDDRLRELREIPARRGLARALRIIPGLLERIEKDILMQFEGADVPLDCEIARELTTPLVHMLRNAFDHGIEMREERLMAGKDPRGTVKLTIVKTAGSLRLMVADDGRGLDTQRLKIHAVGKGVISAAEAHAMSEEDARRLIFLSGFSTAEAVTEISGRGVGMDVVHEIICTRLKGEILIDSETGRGTTFTLKIPLG